VDKRKPTYDLEALKAAADRMRVTLVATRSAAALGFGRGEIAAVIRTMRRVDFYKSMTSHGDHRLWQDVYHVPSPAGTLYVKFTADIVSEFLLLSFKEKDDE
jgi:motility quorum-sensing regulator/GCU-specific mRNA interferase toxin